MKPIEHFQKLMLNLAGWLLLIVFWLLALTTQAQTQTDLLTKPVKLGAKTATVESLLQELQTQHNIPLSYSDDALPMQKKVTLSGSEKTVKEVLDVVFKGSNILYIQRGGQLILKKEGRKTSSSGSNGKQYTISGYITEKGTGESLIGVTVHVPGFQTGTVTNTYGFYSLTLPSDSVQIVYSYIGFQPQAYTFFLDKNLNHNISLAGSAELQAVEITATGVQVPVSQTAQMSVIEIPVAQVKDIPALFGEKDVMKVVQLMPGVQKGGEGQSGLYVRGGGPDQNLIILDEATVYNANHLFGFFSLFNGDAIKSIELTKGGFPARYGGRLSSVVEMNMKDGNKEEIHGEAGIGLISSRLMLEGPLKKNKSSFLVSGRRTYLDALVTPLMPKEARLGYYFYDLNAKVNYDFGRKDKLYLSGYFGKDKFYFDNDMDAIRSNMAVHWGNATGTLRWNHLVNDQIFTNTSLIVSNYRFNVDVEMLYNGNKFFMDYYSGIRDYTLKSDLDYYLNPDNSIRVGVATTTHQFTPSAVVASDSELDQHIKAKNITYSQETGIYAEHTFKPTPRFMVNSGLRLSHFYVQKRNYFRPEPRLNLGYKLTDDLTVKASYATMNQYVHLLSNTGMGLATDLWVPATAKVGPQQSHQVAAGLAKDFPEDLALTIEGYYKKSNKIIGYKEGATFMVVDDPETEVNEEDWENKVTTGQGWSYGGEILLQKKAGRFTGWIGYTLSWTQLQYDSLNFGKKFYARYDRRHDISVVGMYKLNDHVKLSATWVYGTGNAITMPLAEYVGPYDHPSPNAKDQMFDWYGLSGNRTISDYGEMNNFRMEAFHRLDVGLQLTKKLSPKVERTWEISVYNFYNRKNPFYYTMGYRSNNMADPTNQRVVKKVSVFPLIPSVSYNIKF